MYSVYCMHLLPIFLRPRLQGRKEKQGHVSSPDWMRLQSFSFWFVTSVLSHPLWDQWEGIMAPSNPANEGSIPVKFLRYRWSIARLATTSGCCLASRIPCTFQFMLFFGHLDASQQDPVVTLTSILCPRGTRNSCGVSAMLALCPLESPQGKESLERGENSLFPGKLQDHTNSFLSHSFSDEVEMLWWAWIVHSLIRL